jgi:hypothetical protein
MASKNNGKPSGGYGQTPVAKAVVLPTGIKGQTPIAKAPPTAPKKKG